MGRPHIKPGPLQRLQQLLPGDSFGDSFGLLFVLLCADIIDFIHSMPSPHFITAPIDHMNTSIPRAGDGAQEGIPEAMLCRNLMFYVFCGAPIHSYHVLWRTPRAQGSYQNMTAAVSTWATNLMAPCTQTMLRLGPKVCKEDLLWVMWSARVRMDLWDSACGLHSGPSRTIASS